MTVSDGFDLSLELLKSRIVQACATSRSRVGAAPLTVMPSFGYRESWRATLAALHRPAERWLRICVGLWSAR
jgi:hypothetical protein